MSRGGRTGPAQDPQPAKGPGPAEDAQPAQHPRPAEDAQPAKGPGPAEDAQPAGNRRSARHHRPGRDRRSAAAFHPIRILDLEVTRPIPTLVVDGPARLLVRFCGQPIGLVPVSVSVPERALPAQRIREMIMPVVRDQVPAELLPASGLVPEAGLPPQPAPQTGQGAAMTVVVTACAASRGLAHTLRSVRAQRLSPREIIVVDNRPATSRIDELLKDPEYSGIRLIREPIAGLSRARNAGLAATTTELIAFTDDDVIADPGWTAGLVAGFTDDRVACVTGLVLPIELNTPAQVWFEEFGGFAKGFRQRRFDLAEHRGDGPLYPYAAGVFGTGANTAFRVAALRRLGGFDEQLGAGTPARGGEDLDIYLSVVRSGAALVYQPAALIRHHHHGDLPALRRQIHNYGIGLSAMLVKRWMRHRDERLELLRRLPSGARYALDPGSGKNRGKGPGYPPALSFLELCGMLYGPLAYWRSRRAS